VTGVQTCALPIFFNIPRQIYGNWKISRPKIATKIKGKDTSCRRLYDIKSAAETLSNTAGIAVPMVPGMPYRSLDELDVRGYMYPFCKECWFVV